MTDPPFTPQSLAERWECTPQHVYKLIGQEKLPCFRLGSLIRIRAADVTAFEDSGGAVFDKDEDAAAGGGRSGSSSTEGSGMPSGSTRRVAPVVVPFAPGTAGSPGSGSPTR